MNMDESFESNKLENARKFFANGLNEFERVDYIAAEKSFIDSLKTLNLKQLQKQA